jgi:hypothetical protein
LNTTPKREEDGGVVRVHGLMVRSYTDDNSIKAVASGAIRTLIAQYGPS